jgi:hypothetical protein
MVPFKQRTRKMNNETIMQSHIVVKNETWEAVCTDNDRKNKFNSFLYMFLNVFESSFPIKYKSISKTKKKKKDWITQRIQISCKHKKSWYIYSMNSSDSITEAYYNRYCEILNTVIKTG